MVAVQAFTAASKDDHGLPGPLLPLPAMPRLQRRCRAPEPTGGRADLQPIDPPSAQTQTVPVADRAAAEPGRASGRLGELCKGSLSETSAAKWPVVAWRLWKGSRPVDGWPSVLISADAFAFCEHSPATSNRRQHSSGCRSRDVGLLGPDRNHPIAAVDEHQQTIDRQPRSKSLTNCCKGRPRSPPYV
jgi:hypothetical protein